MLSHAASNWSLWLLPPQFEGRGSRVTVSRRGVEWPTQLSSELLIKFC